MLVREGNRVYDCHGLLIFRIKDRTEGDVDYGLESVNKLLVVLG